LIFGVAIGNTRCSIQESFRLINLAENGEVDDREKDVSLEILPDVCDIKFLNEGEKLLVDGAATDDEGFLLVTDGVENSGYAMYHLSALMTESRIVGQNNVTAFGERATREGVPSVTSHYDGMA
jgi:hypothetical protein